MERKRLTQADKWRKTSRWQSLRLLVLARDNYSCQDCGSRHKLQAHHIQPVAKGGKMWSLSNLTTLCASCNYRAGSTLGPQARAWRRYARQRAQE